MEFGTYGNRKGGASTPVVKSTCVISSDCVLAMYRTVLLVPGTVTFTAFEEIGRPLPKSPI